MGPIDVVRALVEPVLAAEGLELFDCELKPGLLRVAVDGPGGVSVDRLGQLSQRLSRLLDEHDPIPERYTLEVTSPGLERQLRTPEHFRKAVGDTVTLRLTAAAEGERRLQGTLESADADGVVLAGHRVPYAQIDRARTVFAWGGAPKPGKSPKSSQPTQQQKKAVR